ncbi:MAG: hypothetical protein ACJA1I_000486 [Zhongshania marina]|jgi:hypothetical protein
MPGRAEYGLLAGLGQGIAQAGQMAYADHLQQMREARLAKIASEAADGKFARDKELLGMETENRREELGIRSQNEKDLVGLRVDEEVRGKKELGDYYLKNGLGADGRADKANKWQVIKSDDSGAIIPTGISNGQNFIDFKTPLGKVVKSFLDQGAPAELAVTRGQEALMQIGGGGAQEEAAGQPQTEEPGFWGGLMGSFFENDEQANSLPASSNTPLPQRVPQSAQALPAQQAQDANPFATGMPSASGHTAGQMVGGGFDRLKLLLSDPRRAAQLKRDAYEQK